MFMTTRRRAHEIYAEMLKDLEDCIFVSGITKIATHKIYLETRLMILRLQPSTRQTRRSMRAIRWLLESLESI